jgi:hypothetical protein
MKRTLTNLWNWLNRPRGRKRATTRRRSQRGSIALMAVLIALSVTLVMTVQFASNTNIDLFAAANYRDQMRSHYLARSAVALSELVIRLQQRLDNDENLKGTQITEFADQILLAFCGGNDEVKSAVGFSLGTVKGVGADIGTCGIIDQQITTEDDKLNVNCFNTASAEVFKSAVDGLIYFDAYNPIFEEADAEGWRRDRETQVLAMVDYIDSNTLRGFVKAGTSPAQENYDYMSLKDPYKEKNFYLDTVEELKLVRGIDDRFWSLFGDAFTVYGGCKINLSALTNRQLIASVLYLSAADNEPLKNDPKRLYALAGLIAQARQFGERIDTVADFVKFAKDPQASLLELAGKGQIAGAAAQSALNNNVPGLSGSDKVGMTLDAGKLGRIASAGPRRTYRVRAFGEIPRGAKDNEGKDLYPPIRTTVNAVWDTKAVPSNVRKPVPKGTWVYMRED